MVSRVTAFVSNRWRVSPQLIRVDIEPLHGGLESTVARARITGPEECGSIPEQLVVKELPAGFDREANVYEALWRHLDPPPAVRMLGREASERGTYLYLEEAHSSAPWPWTDVRRAGAVCRALARLHDSRMLAGEAFTWDYERELAHSAVSTLELAADARDMSGRRCWDRPGDLRRVVAALPRIRERLLSGGTTLLHGDMHPGNVILRGESDPQVLLIDWARARVGSPLEDVASWLHSLGCWEPEARRRHDTLMRIYLGARAAPRRFDADVRVSYWLASASNGLSGAIRYHLAVRSDPERSEADSYDSSRALVAWQRVIKRVAGLLSTNLDRRT